jgi:uncharacterized protein YdhG (YjbR/CyaY superfamily)
MDARGATTVEEHLARLPADRREAVARVREVVNANLPDGFEEGVQHGMISWYVPLARFPETYNGQPLAIAAIASQKSYMALHLVSVYGDPQLAAWFRDAFAKAGKRLDMGKGCVRFKAVDALPLDVIGETIRRVPLEVFLRRYEEVRAGRKSAKRAAKAKPKPGAKGASAKRPAAKAKANAKAKRASAKRLAAKAKAKQPKQAVRGKAATGKRPRAKR